MKTPAQTCGPMGPTHAYLGRFQKAKHLNRGHNSDPVEDLLDVRKQGGLPSEQQRERLHRDRTDSIRKEAEANARKLPTMDTGMNVEAPTSRDANTYGPTPGRRFPARSM